METQEHLVQELAWLRRVVVGLVGDEATAADLSQEVALEALRRPPAAQGAVLEGARLRGWLWTMARRKAGRGRERTAVQVRSEREAARPDATDGFARSAQQLEVHGELLSEISALDPEDASLISQRYLDQMPPREIARCMDLPVPTVRKRLSRAMERLRERLVQSDRGAEGWSLGLCLIVGSSGVPMPVGGKPGKVSGGDAPTYLGGAAALKWAGLALILVGVGAALVWLNRSPDPMAETELERLAQVEIDEAGGQGPAALPSSVEVVATGREAVSVAASGPGAKDSVTAALSPTSSVRFLSEAGVPLASARAVWADEHWTPRPLNVDERGIALLPADARGFVYAGGDGLENQSIPIAWSNAGGMTVELRGQRQIPGRLLVDGLAPGREVTLWQGRYGYNVWPSEIDRDERMKAVLKSHGISWTRGPFKTTADGHFVYTTNATWSNYFLAHSSEFQLVRAEGVRSILRGRSVSFLSDSEGLLLEVTRRECVTGRLVWQGDQQPLTGRIGMYPLDEGGEWVAEVMTFVDLDGRFSLPLHLDRTYSGHAGEKWQAFAVHVDETEVAYRLDKPGEAHDLGTIEFPRAPVAHLRVLGRTVDGTVPLMAVVASEFEEVLSDDSGAASVHAAVGSTVRILAEGYGYREVAVTSQAALSSTPQVVELDAASRLNVRFELAHRVGFDPSKSIKVVLRMRTHVFEGEVGSEEASEEFWRAYRRLVGQRAQYFEAEGDDWGLGAGEAFFQGVPDTDLWIDCLRPGASFDVELQDMLGQVLAKEAVTMPLTADTRVQSVDFGDVYKTGAAAVDVTCLVPSSNEPYQGSLYIVRGDGRRMKNGRCDESGKLAWGPLLPGQYRFVEGSSGTPRSGEGVPVTLVEGQNQVTIEAIGRGTGR